MFSCPSPHFEVEKKKRVYLLLKAEEKAEG